MVENIKYEKIKTTFFLSNNKSECSLLIRLFLKSYLLVSPQPPMILEIETAGCSK